MAWWWCGGYKYNMCLCAAYAPFLVSYTSASSFGSSPWSMPIALTRKGLSSVSSIGVRLVTW